MFRKFKINIPNIIPRNVCREVKISDGMVDYYYFVFLPLVTLNSSSSPRCVHVRQSTRLGEIRIGRTTRGHSMVESLQRSPFFNTK